MKKQAGHEELETSQGTIGSRLDAVWRYTEKLTQSILGRAIRGELVPTEAELARREGRSYESASELLARIETLSNSSKSRLFEQTQKHAYGSD